jgi:hypothetical protein
MKLPPCKGGQGTNEAPSFVKEGRGGFTHFKQKNDIMALVH